MLALFEALRKLDPLALNQIEAENPDAQHRIAPVTFEAPQCSLDLTRHGVWLPAVSDDDSNSD